MFSKEVKALRMERKQIFIETKLKYNYLFQTESFQNVIDEYIDAKLLAANLKYMLVSK